MKSYLEVIFAAVLFGSTGVFVKKLGLPSTVISFFRLFTPVVIFLPFLLSKKESLFRGDYKTALSASVLNALRMFLYFLAYSYTSLANGVIILYTWPIFASIFSYLILKEKIDKRLIYLLPLTFAGIILVYLNKPISFESHDFLGMTFMLASAVLCAITTVMFKKVSDDYNRYEVIFFQNIAGGLIFLPFLFFTDSIFNWHALGGGLSYSFVNIAGLILFFSALKKIKASTVSFLTYTEVVSAIILGWIFLHETPAWNVGLGAAFIILPKAVFLMLGGEKKRA